MKILAIILGILGFIFMFSGLFPCLGWLNWINLVFSTTGLVIALYYFTKSEADKQDSNTRIALFLNGCAFLIGIVRLVIGGGFF